MDCCVPRAIVCQFTKKKIAAPREKGDVMMAAPDSSAFDWVKEQCAPNQRMWIKTIDNVCATGRAYISMKCVGFPYIRLSDEEYCN